MKSKKKPYISFTGLNEWAIVHAQVIYIFV